MSIACAYFQMRTPFRQRKATDAAKPFAALRRETPSPPGETKTITPHPVSSLRVRTQ